MTLEFPLQAEVDKVVKIKNQQRPLNMAQAKEVTAMMAEPIGQLNLDKGRRRELNAKIFHYLTAGSNPSTHGSGKYDGEIKSVSKVRPKARFNKSKYKRV